jgi:hypothetical protein
MKGLVDKCAKLITAVKTASKSASSKNKAKRDPNMPKKS